jgi:hypothetical protein
MALGKNRSSIFVRGLGKAEILKKEPTLDTAFSDIGYLKSAQISDISDMIDIGADNGQVVEYLEGSERCGMELQLLQSSFDEVDALRQMPGKIYAVRYAGLTNTLRYQYWCMESCRIDPSVNLTFQGSTERTVPARIRSLYQDVGYDIPLFFMVDAKAEIATTGLRYWLAPRMKANYATAKALEISGFGYHGTLGSNFVNLWQPNGLTSVVPFLRFGGVSTDYMDAGDDVNLDFAATEDWMIEAWISTPAANGSQLRFVTKKQSTTSTDKGFMLQRFTNNAIQLLVSDGATQITTATTSTLLQNTIKHVAFTVKKGGVVTPYMNGVADGSTQAIGASYASDNALGFQLARDNAGNYGQVDVHGVRLYGYPGGTLPSDIATTIANHYAAERGFFGV